MKKATISCGYYSPLQKQLVLGFPALALSFYLLAVPNLPTVWLEAVTSAYSLAIAGVLIYGVLCTSIPATPTSSPVTGGRLCEKCLKVVETAAVHCDDCNICVIEFRAHSNWLGNCICRKNSNWYFGLLLSLLVCSVLQVVASVWVLVLAFSDSELSQVRYRQRYSVLDGGYSFRLVLLFSCSVCFCVAVAGIKMLREFLQAALQRHLEKAMAPESQQSRELNSINEARLLVSPTTPHIYRHAVNKVDFSNLRDTADIKEESEFPQAQ